MFGLFVITIIIALVTGLSENETIDNRTIVEAKSSTPHLFTDLKNQ